MFKISYIYDLVDNITPQLKKIAANIQSVSQVANSSMQSVSRSFEATKQSVEKVGKSFKDIGSTLAPVSVATGLIGAKAFKSAADMEMLRIRMNVLTGSVEKGAIAFDEVTKYAAKTPFEIADISKSLNMLMSTGGMSFEDAMKSVKVLGDIASISGGDMSGMALAFSQTSATTRLLGQDFNQFVNNSVPLMKILTDYTGKSSAEIMAMKEAGKLSFDVVAKAMEKATQKGGLFENGAEKMSKTLGGLASTLKDNINIAFAELGTEMAKSINLSELIGKISDYVGKLTNAFRQLSPETKKIITYGVLITTALAPLALTLATIIGTVALAVGGFSLLAGGIAFLISPIGIATGLVAGLGTAIYLLKDDFVIIGDYLQNTFIKIFDDIAKKINDFRKDLSIVLDFVGLEKLSNIVAPSISSQQALSLSSSAINNPEQINKPQQFTAGGSLDINILGLPKGSKAGFTPAPKNFLPVGINSVFAGS